MSHEKPAKAPHTGQAAQQPAKSEETIRHLQQEIEQSKERYLRALAEFDNAKKRLEREKEEFAKYASHAIVRELLPIVDSLDQALAAVDKQAEPQAVIKGVHLIYRQLLGLLEKEGVKRIPTVGEPFNPHHHEAVAQVEAGDGVAENTIVEQVQVGYTLHGKVLRPAMVKVAKSSRDEKSDVGSRKLEVGDEQSESAGGKSEASRQKTDS